jgi:glycosyltransferase involved in cell wall biosynthesis
MAIHSILVCEAQVPFVHGGAESLVRDLVRELRQRGYRAELVSVPFKWYPKDEILAHAAAWRLLDLSESNGSPVDLVIGTKFPTYFVRHPRKVVWLMHQYRAAYELVGGPYSDFGHREFDVALRRQIVDLDRAMLQECDGLYAIARNTAARVERYNGLKAEAVYHPPRLAGRLRGGPATDYVLSVGRLETIKRIDLVIRAVASLPPGLRLLVAGAGTQRANLERLIDELGAGDRVTLLGAVDDETLLGLYRDALAVVYPPYDEDYGYVTLEAFLAGKPVVTARDSGGTLEFVEHGVNGFICDPDPAALAEACARLDADRPRAAAMGDAGRVSASLITWDGVIASLVRDPAGKAQ